MTTDKPLFDSIAPVLFEVTPYALCLARWPSGEFIYVNAEWSKRFGFSKEEFIGKDSTQILIHPSLEERTRFFETCGRERRVRNYEINIVTKSGEPRVISCNVDLMEIGGEQLMFGAIEDITDRRKTEQALKSSQESLVFALESASMGTWEIDLQKDIVHCSKAMLDIWGVDSETFHGERAALQSKVHPDDLEPMKNAINAAIERRSIYEIDYRIYPRPGELRWVNSRGRCTYKSGTDTPVRLSGVVYDITEQRMAREVAEKAIRARDNMISISAHELLTPISGSKLHLQTLKKKLEKGDDLSRETLIKIAKQTNHDLNRLSKLVADMLDISRINLGKLTLKREKVNLSALISDTVDRSMATIESAGCSVYVIVEPDVEAWIDSYRIEQVLSNLISNACRYAFGKKMEIRMEKKGDVARLTVLDRGIGIKTEDQLRIFERFERATTLNEKAGLGLGLFLVKQIVEAHSGHVFLESQFGKGAKFTVELPLGANGYGEQA